jgi:hypothetical protein
MLTEYVNNRLAPATFCDSVIVLHVDLDGDRVVGVTRTSMIDTALQRRAVKATGDAAKAQAQKKQQDDLQKAQSAKPSL